MHLLSHQRHQSDKTLGYYTLLMDRVVDEGHVHLVDSFSDINDRNLPVSNTFVNSYKIKYLNIKLYFLITIKIFLLVTFIWQIVN